MSTDERPPARRRAAPQLPDPMSPVTPVPPAPVAQQLPATVPAPSASAPARPTRDVPASTPAGDAYDQAQWSGFTVALGGRIAAEAKALLMPLAKAHGLKTERAVIEKLIIDASRAAMPDGPPDGR